MLVLAYVTLGADPTSWVSDILHRWRDLVLEDFEVQIAAIDPMTDDQAPNVFAQLLLIQRPDRFMRPVIVTIPNTAVQRGLLHSCAVVASAHVRLHGVLLMTGLLYQCPPELLHNQCRLFYGTCELRGEAFIPAVHGDVFNQVIQRDVTVDIQELLTLSIPHLRQRLAAILDQGVQQLQVPEADRPPVLSPDYFNSLELAFDALAAPERLEEGPLF